MLNTTFGIEIEGMVNVDNVISGARTRFNEQSFLDSLLLQERDEPNNHATERTSELLISRLSQAIKEPEDKGYHKDETIDALLSEEDQQLHSAAMRGVVELDEYQKIDYVENAIYPFNDVGMQVVLDRSVASELNGKELESHLIPVEIVSPVIDDPNYYEFFDSLRDVTDFLDLSSNKTCGMHVHLGVSETGLNASDHLLFMKNMSMLYIAAEDALDNGLRGNTMYADALGSLRNSYHMPDDMAMQARVDNAQTIDDLINTVNPDGRYYKVNLRSYQKHGTIEVRHHPGFENVEQAQTWVDYLNEFVGIAKEATLDGAFLSVSDARQLLEEHGLDTYERTPQAKPTNYDSPSQMKGADKLEALKEQLEVEEQKAGKAAEANPAQTEMSWVQRMKDQEPFPDVHETIYR